MKEEEIRTAIDGMDETTLKDTLALLLSEGSSVQPDIQTAQPEYANFAQALLSLKKKYKFPELAQFTTEADLVYVQTGDRRILLTDRSAPAPAAKQEIPYPDQDTTFIDPRTVQTTESNDDMDNAFEPETKESGRFGRLEM
jgi:hypothetical protein